MPLVTGDEIQQGVKDIGRGELFNDGLGSKINYEKKGLKVFVSSDCQFGLVKTISRYSCRLALPDS